MTSLQLITVVDLDLLVECFQLTMTISLFWKVQQFPVKGGHQDKARKLRAQSFQTFAPLSKVGPFRHEVFSLISVKEVGELGGMVAGSVPPSNSLELPLTKVLVDIPT